LAAADVRYRHLFLLWLWQKENKEEDIQVSSFRSLSDNNRIEMFSGFPSGPNLSQNKIRPHHDIRMLSIWFLFLCLKLNSICVRWPRRTLSSRADQTGLVLFFIGFILLRYIFDDCINYTPCFMIVVPGIPCTVCYAFIPSHSFSWWSWL